MADNNFSDVIIKFGDKQVFAHKVILARGSLWFDKALSGNFSEANKKVIELHDDVGSGAVMTMLKHIYGSNYKEQYLDEDDDATVEMHHAVFILGDKYDISSLREEAAARFEKFLAKESRDGEYYDATILTIQKLLGPHAPQLADKSLTERATCFVYGDYKHLLCNYLFRALMAEGSMLHKDLAMEVLEMVSNQL
ncbi:hypothetical protein M436DRAFT_72001 [Aureobasidium namibiae CBS 147.97]|uniref:BTB domain-containing protein n=1 Tax=Aureobasidium namibiae CBS 147.97 TaxID=1043004 RepID=A0A074XJ68_9PEZI|nr:uncharacterized protein M436DRAFT_72001 [Aureobasidium namibiae CBS 147.97]KEQ74591.1 hypothetical protein M436DRAFT_72001 [Aureobasidium namibiae CBS 147.97]